MKIGSLFSGIGGLELGLERAGLGSVAWQVEIDPYRRAVLEKHWSNTLRFEDVKTVGAHNLPAIDLICGGFPCKNVSSAGDRTGLTGNQSSLWYEFLRVIAECRPQWVVIENVASGAKLWVDFVTRDLEQLGYASFPVPIAASDCGAFHRRGRIFIVAHVNNSGQYVKPVNAEVGSTSQPVADWAGGRFFKPDMVRMVHGVPRGLDGARRRALGDSVVPQQSEVVGHFIKMLVTHDL